MLIIKDSIKILYGCTGTDMSSHLKEVNLEKLVVSGDRIGGAAHTGHSEGRPAEHQQKIAVVVGAVRSRRARTRLDAGSGRHAHLCAGAFYLGVYGKG